MTAPPKRDKLERSRRGLLSLGTPLISTLRIWGHTQVFPLTSAANDDLFWVEPQEREHRTPHAPVPVQQVGSSELGGNLWFSSCRWKVGRSMPSALRLEQYMPEEENQGQLFPLVSISVSTVRFLARWGLSLFGGIVSSLRRGPRPGVSPSLPQRPQMQCPTKKRG